MTVSRRWILSAPLALTLTPTLFLRPGFAQEAETPEIKDVFLGNADAKVEVIEYASYTCPHCKSFHETAFKELKREYIDTGKIKFIYREVYFDRLGLWASMLARCGGGEKFFPLTDLLYQRQREWAVSEAANAAENLKKMGRIVGLPNETVEACFADGDMAKALVANFQTNASTHNINATPSFVINGQTYSAMPYGKLKALIEAELDGT